MHIENLSLEQLDRHNSRLPHSQITQSSAWANIMENEEHEVSVKGLINQGALRTAWLMVRYGIGGKICYFYSPRIDFSALDLAEVQYIAREMELLSAMTGAIFWRFDPMAYFAIDEKRPVPTLPIQPETSIFIDLGASEEEILAAMHPKTRYNIRLAEKKGVSVRSGLETDFDAWWPIMEQTVKRDGFRLHSRSHYQRLVDESDGKMNLWVAEYQGKVLSGNIISWFGDTASYLHGASADTDRQAMAPYSLQWHIIRLARERGYRYYDFNGIDESRWPGVTRFKRGFGGQEIAFPGTFDLVFNETLYKVYKFLRSVRRGFAKYG